MIVLLCYLKIDFLFATILIKENNRSVGRPRFLLEMEDVEVEEGFMATFKVKLDLGYPRARVLFYRNDILILNDQRHEICKLVSHSYSTIK